MWSNSLSERKTHLGTRDSVYKYLSVCVYVRNRCGKGNSSAVYTSR